MSAETDIYANIAIMKNLLPTLFLLLMTAPLTGRTFYLSPDGRDSAPGTIDAPFATLNRAQARLSAGDTLWIRGGTYRIDPQQIMSFNRQYAKVFDLDKSGERNKPICYFGYPDERPVFDFSAVRPEGKRVSAFYIAGSWLHLRNFDIIGVQVTVKGHTQSECISARGGSHCIFENLAMHDGMAIGYYQTAGSDNLVLNCDAYNNYDPYSEGPYGGNVDGFGGHVLDAGWTGNVFRGCRAWYNSDDGYDLIRAHAAFTIENCWSFLNGYQPGTMERAGDGTGFKAGGFGMKAEVPRLNVIPRHIIRNCLAYMNKNKGFYANHHLGGITWINNTGYKNPSNFCMLNRQAADVIRDTTGYGHILVDNLSFEPLHADKHLIDADTARCILVNNSFAPIDTEVTADDFISLDPEELKAPRKADGSLPDIDFLRLRKKSPLHGRGVGYSFE